MERGKAIRFHLGRKGGGVMAKAKAPAREYELVDSEGVAWAVAVLSATRLNALLREYKRQEIYLTPRERISA